MDVSDAVMAYYGRIEDSSRSTKMEFFSVRDLEGSREKPDDRLGITQLHKVLKCAQPNSGGGSSSLHG